MVHETDDAAAFVVERLRWDEAGGFRGFRWDDIWTRKARLEGKAAELWRDKTRGFASVKTVQCLQAGAVKRVLRLAEA